MSRLKRFEAMLRIRRFEETVIQSHEAGEFEGHYHLYIGQEQTACMLQSMLRDEDLVFSTHRNHGHLLAQGADPFRLLSEILGRQTGYCGGKAGSMHIAAPGLGVPATSALVGGSMPIAVGAAVAKKVQGREGIVLCYIGDGTLEEGACYEALNLAALWEVPILFLCENNGVDIEESNTLHAVSMLAATVTAVPEALGIESRRVDGLDEEAMERTLAQAVESVRRGKRPFFVEVRTPRWPGSIPRWAELPAGPFDLCWLTDTGGISDERSRRWHDEGDPLVKVGRLLLASGEASFEDLKTMDGWITATIKEAHRKALASSYPEPESAYLHVFSTSSGKEDVVQWLA